jgi:enoyl-CoA hydratase/carnithine racemase
MTNSSGSSVEVERRDAVAWITLNRPHVINAINQEIRAEVPRLLRELDDDPTVRIIVVRGAGARGFCAGADLKEERAASTQRESDLNRIGTKRALPFKKNGHLRSRRFKTCLSLVARP